MVYNIPSHRTGLGILVWIQTGTGGTVEAGTFPDNAWHRCKSVIFTPLNRIVYLVTSSTYVHLGDQGEVENKLRRIPMNNLS